jgi:hypothetical protein
MSALADSSVRDLAHVLAAPDERVGFGEEPHRGGDRPRPANRVMFRIVPAHVRSWGLG